MEKFKIMVIDDISVQRNVVTSILKHRNDIEQILEATDGNEALDAIRENHDLDLIITDYNMPNLSGLDLIKSIKRDHSISHIPVIIISAEVSKDNMLEAIEAGAAMEILKPFNSEDLNNSIDYILKSVEV